MSYIIKTQKAFSIFIIILIGFLFSGFLLKFCGIYIIKSDSMIPTLLSNDIILIKKCNHDHINNILIFKNPNTQDELIIKRCIAEMYDTVLLSNDYLRILKNKTNKNVDHSIDYENKITVWNENTILIRDDTRFIIPGKNFCINKKSKNFNLYISIINYCEDHPYSYLPETTIDFCFKKDYYYMIGDYMEKSRDSRHFGPIPEDKIIGKATHVLFNYHNGKFRWDRFLKKIE